MNWRTTSRHINAPKAIWALSPSRVQTGEGLIATQNEKSSTWTVVSVWLGEREISCYVVCTIWSHVSHTDGILSADPNTKNQTWDDFDGVQREESAKDEPRSAVQCPHTEDHCHCIYQCDSSCCKWTWNLTICSTNKNQCSPFAKNLEYSAFEVSLSRVDIGTIG